MKEKIKNLPVGVRVLAPTVAVAVLVGLGVGLWIGWMALPIQLANVGISDLKGSAQDEYILLIAKTYAYDRNLDRARERLAQLNDSNMVDRVGTLAMTYASQNNQEAAQLASFAVALGSQDSVVALLAATATPAVAMVVTPTAAATAAVPTLLTTLTPTPTLPGALTRTPTRRPTPTAAATATAKPNPVIPTTMLPSSLADWPGGFRVDPSNAAPGQQYWHLTKAIYCDITETQFGCTDKSGPPTLPGGPYSIGVWVKLVGAKAPLILDGKPANLEDKSSDTECQCTFTLDFPGPTIQIGNYPSERIVGAANTSVKVGNPNTHVRYFFTFQLVTQ
jgi:hypothetical protein